MRNSGLTKVDTNTLSVVVLISIIGFIIVVIAARIIFTTLSGETNNHTEPAQTTPSPALLRNSTLNTITLNANNLNLLPQLIDRGLGQANGEVMEIKVANSDGEEVSPSYVFGLLGLNTTPALNQSLTSIRFIGSGRGDKSILLKFTEVTAVQGGMLMWESDMAENLSSIYAFDQDLSEAGFIDRSLAGKDVRILVADGEVVLLYSIIDDNTAVITRSTANFNEIVELGLR